MVGDGDGPPCPPTGVPCVTTVRWVARRTATTLLAALAVLTVTYVAISIAPAYRSGALELQPAPTMSEYLTWLGDLVTLEWGQSTSLRDPVTDLVWAGLKRTAAYVLPAAVFATTIGTLIGLRSATGGGTRFDSGVNVAAYVGLGVPNFVLGVLLLVVFARDATGEVVHTSDIVQTIIWPAAVLTTTLTAAQIRYTRSEAAEYAHSELARLVRAAGGGPRDVARHVLRNAAVPLVSLFFTELLAVLLLNVYVIESVFAIRGIGFMNFWAIMRGDLPLVVGTTVVFVLVGVGGSYVQDLVYAVLDPRVDAD